MKNIFNTRSLLVGLLWSVLVLMGACNKFLEEDMRNAANPNEFYTKEEEVKGAVNGIYNSLYSIFVPDFFIYVEGATDLAVSISSANFNGTFGFSPSAPAVGQTVWEHGFKGVMYANNTVDGIKRSPLSDAVKNKHIAEAVTLRAFYYYILTNTFNDVPFWMTPLGTEDDVNEIIKLKRTDAKVIRDSLINELERYASYLPMRNDAPNTGRVNRAFAFGLIAKMALIDKKWDKAIDATDSVINAESYVLVAPYDKIYTEKNSEESIFELQYSYSPTGVQRSHSVFNFCMPAPKSNNSYDGVNFGTLNTATTYATVRPTKKLEEMYTSNDTRIKQVLANSYNNVSFNRFKNQGRYWLGPKFWDFTSINIASGKNLLVMRYADILLMHAEALIESGNLEDGLYDINLIRSRSQAGVMALGDQGEMRTLVRDERARELMGEYTRKWDLVRWGTFYSALKAVPASDFATVSQNVKPYHLYYPIPAIEIAKNPNLVQNPGY